MERRLGRELRHSQQRLKDYEEKQDSEQKGARAFSAEMPSRGQINAQ
jgi:hypothetical protein